MIGSAADIYQSFLDAGSELLMAAAFDALADSMVYPQTMETSDSVVRYENRDMMIDAVEHFRGFLSGVGATDYHRVCHFATFEPGSDVIAGEHTTYILKGGSFAVPPYRNRMWLRRVNDHWCGSGIAAAVENRTCMILSPKQLRTALETHP